MMWDKKHLLYVQRKHWEQRRGCSRFHRTYGRRFDVAREAYTLYVQRKHWEQRRGCSRFHRTYSVHVLAVANITTNHCFCQVCFFYLVEDCTKNLSVQEVTGFFIVENVIG